MNMNGMNDTVKLAWDKLYDQRTDRVRIEELTGYATRAFFNFGPFSSVSISNRMNLWSYMTQKASISMTGKREHYFTGSVRSRTG